MRTLPLLLVAGLTGTAAADPRTILYNGDIFTGDPAQPHAHAIAITGDRVTAVGSDADVLKLATPSTRMIDLRGRVVIPGIDDAHVHMAVPLGVYVNSTAFVPGPGPTLTEIETAIAAQAAATPPGTLLLGFVGTNFMDDPGADRFSLDTVSPGHPVVLFGWAGHGTFFNTAAMGLLGIGAMEPDPFGGNYDRVGVTPIVNGAAHEYAEFWIRRKLLDLLPDAVLVDWYRSYAAQAAQLGVTSIQDMGVGLTHDRAMSILRTANLPLRVRSICVPLTLSEPCVTTNATPTDRLRAAGVKWISDGTPIERRAFVMEPYQDDPDNVGSFNFPLQPFLELTASQRTGVPSRDQVLFHSVGDAAISTVLDALELTGGNAWVNRRPRIEHGDMMFGADVQRAASLGVVVVQNGTHLGLTPVWAQRYVPEVFAQLEPIKTLLDAGVHLALGTDSIGRPISPYLDMMLLAIHPTHPAEAITVEQSVTAYTSGSAYAELEETNKGSLQPGRYADLAVLSQDIFHTSPFMLPATFSVLTMVGGDIVWNAGIAP